MILITLAYFNFINTVLIFYPTPKSWFWINHTGHWKMEPSVYMSLLCNVLLINWLQVGLISKHTNSIFEEQPVTESFHLQCDSHRVCDTSTYWPWWRERVIDYWLILVVCLLIRTPISFKIIPRFLYLNIVPSWLYFLKPLRLKK